ncbi:MAG: hypothetical protein ACRENI_07110 [Gemmatimonadaceae bacterium]
MPVGPIGVVGKVLGLAILALVSACNGGSGDERGRSGTEAAADTPGAEASMVVMNGQGQKGGEKHNGEGKDKENCVPDNNTTTPAYADRLVDGKPFWDYVNNLCFSEFPGSEATVLPDAALTWILPEQGAHKVPFDSLAEDKGGRVMARIINVDPDNDATKLKSGKKLEKFNGKEYAYLWMGRNAAGKAAGVIFRKGNGWTVDRLVEGEPIVFTSDGAHTYAAASWHPPHTSIKADVSALTSHRSAWTSCAGGCCTAPELIE